MRKEIKYRNDRLEEFDPEEDRVDPFLIFGFLLILLGGGAIWTFHLLRLWRW